MTTIYLGADHGGFELKEDFKRYVAQNHSDLLVQDCGAFTFVETDDYPSIALEVATQVSASENHVGILFCRSGSGMVIAANKVRGVRAVEVYDEHIAKQAKSHNRANVIAFGADYLSLSQVAHLFEIFMDTAIDFDARHARRIQQISDYESKSA